METALSPTEILLQTVTDFINRLHEKGITFPQGETLFHEEAVVVLSQSQSQFEFLIEAEHEEMEDVLVMLEVGADAVSPYINKKIQDWNNESYAALLKLAAILRLPKTRFFEHKYYTREGMIQRVLKERKERALKEEYTIKWGSTIYGDHILTNQKGKSYKVFLRDFRNETGYSNSPDAKVNKLGTTKHIMYAFHQLKSNRELFGRLSKDYPFVEVYLDPLNDYRITWYYEGKFPSIESEELIKKYFGQSTFIEAQNERNFLRFINEASVLEDILVRGEVIEKIDKLYRKDSLRWVSQNHSVDYDKINATLYDYQKEGVEFITFKEGCILADEMGLGKTLQSISAAIAKKEIFAFKKTLIVCPASLKAQWKSEIEKFSNEKAVIVEGSPEDRKETYLSTESYFLITNYEAVMRDSVVINQADIDLLILDEAQRIKNFETKTAGAIQRLQKKHTLVLTGTPIENKLVDLYSIMQVVEPEFLGPLWEFSQQHCFFDQQKVNKINGYYNLKPLKEKLKEVLLRREKRKVIDQLPNISQQNITVKMGDHQAEYHSSCAQAVTRILHKKFITPADMTRLNQMLTMMRMVCDSTYLVDEETNESPKLLELEHILIEKLDLKNADKKIIIFSEWLKSLALIEQLLRKHDIEFTTLSGKVPVKKRGELIKKFEEDSNCKVFLSTEAGGSGLNLQVADTLINFELPWNPAKKNQRIGRIDRLGQKNNKLTVLNFLTEGSIEMRIASGLMVKQNLFDGVLNDGNETDVVDFSEKGRSQFLQELEEMIDSFGKEQTKQEEEIEETSDIEATIEGKNTASQQEVEDQKAQVETQTEKLEQVLSQGMGFFAGLYQMATGNEVNASDQKIDVNKETGEVTLKFKIPM